MRAAWWSGSPNRGPPKTKVEVGRAPRCASAQRDVYCRNVYTVRVDERPVVWDAANRRHLAEDHPERGITLDEIVEVLDDSRRVEGYLENRDAFQVIGKTAAGRWLVVIWIDQATGRYPLHAREASRRIIRRISK